MKTFCSMCGVGEKQETHDQCLECLEAVADSITVLDINSMLGHLGRELVTEDKLSLEEKLALRDEYVASL